MRKIFTLLACIGILFAVAPAAQAVPIMQQQQCIYNADGYHYNVGVGVAYATTPIDQWDFILNPGYRVCGYTGKYHSFFVGAHYCVDWSSYTNVDGNVFGKLWAFGTVKGGNSWGYHTANQQTSQGPLSYALSAYPC